MLAVLFEAQEIQRKQLVTERNRVFRSALLGLILNVGNVPKNRAPTNERWKQEETSEVLTIMRSGRAYVARTVGVQYLFYSIECAIHRLFRRWNDRVYLEGVEEHRRLRLIVRRVEFVGRCQIVRIGRGHLRRALDAPRSPSSRHEPTKNKEKTKQEDRRI